MNEFARMQHGLPRPGASPEMGISLMSPEPEEIDFDDMRPDDPAVWIDVVRRQEVDDDLHRRIERQLCDPELIAEHEDDCAVCGHGSGMYQCQVRLAIIQDGSEARLRQMDQERAMMEAPPAHMISRKRPADDDDIEETAPKRQHIDRLPTRTAKANRCLPSLEDVVESIELDAATTSHPDRMYFAIYATFITDPNLPLPRSILDSDWTFDSLTIRHSLGFSHLIVKTHVDDKIGGPDDLASDWLEGLISSCECYGAKKMTVEYSAEREMVREEAGLWMEDVVVGWLGVKECELVEKEWSAKK
ncbi:hypothetical protein LTR56_005436 [Elasticomyces elasticus]|nr:hypothetical protein LTR22_015254 [Elasticomyces elasticus]KAK3651927.1 hypothetical protein LTR56_005436 [Elasticomyces elasticus]KAK4927822.1 hypothetical protein LTR49_005448 [Elasticomyces elasticus]KAK5750890.1 hypothetical protein LTS12_019033 [Elasticomyces elasticus]